MSTEGEAKDGIGLLGFLLRLLIVAIGSNRSYLFCCVINLYCKR